MDIKNKDYGLGRLESPDSRDQAFPMGAALDGFETTRTYRYWNIGPWQGNQGNTQHCVDYAFLHWLQAGPVLNRNAHNGPWFGPGYIYRLAQQIDEWPGAEPSYYGTSVRAGAKVLQNHGLIEAYYWGRTLDDVVNSVLTKGPVVLGTAWYSGMFNPDSTGLIRPTGKIGGGHAWMLYGVNKTTRMAYARNSWGTGWGRNGLFRISFDDLGMLISQRGEAISLATERYNPQSVS